MGRNFVIQDQDEVVLTADKATSKLQKRSERRAIVNFLVDNGGKAKLHDINNNFGYDCRAKVQSLVRVGWLCVQGERS